MEPDTLGTLSTINVHGTQQCHSLDPKPGSHMWNVEQLKLPYDINFQ